MLTPANELAWRRAKYAENMKSEEWREHRRTFHRKRYHKISRTVSGSFLLNRNKARVRGLLWEITETEYAELRARSCVYCGDELPPTGSGLDRIDNTIGYVRGNLVSCCVGCNLTRRDSFTYEEMLKLGKTIRKIKRARKLGELGTPASP